MAADPNGAQTVARAARLLDLFTLERPDCSVSEVARALDLAKTTAHRLLATLRAAGYLRQDELTDRYALGAKVLALARVYEANHDLARIAQPFMERLLAEVNETVAIFVREGDFRYCIARLESTHDMRVVVRIGQPLPLDRGASGRILGLDYASARAVGSAISRGERIPNAYGIAAPLFDGTRKVVAALDLSGPLNRFSVADAKRNSRRVEATARQISRALGDPEGLPRSSTRA